MTVFRPSKFFGIMMASLVVRLALNGTGQAEDFAYTNINGTITIIGYAGPGGAVTIPSTIAGLPVTSIANNVFLSLTNLISVTLPESLTSIGEWAFASCTALTSITLPNSVTNLGFASLSGCTSLESATLSINLTGLQNGAFQGCSKLVSISIPDSVANIGWGAFLDCGSLTKVTIGNGVLSIGQFAFGDCTNLASITIPAGTISIDPGAFQSLPGALSGVRAIDVDPLNSVYHSVDGVLFNKDGTTLIAYPPGKQVENYVMPGSVLTIGPGAFNNCSNLRGLTFGTNVAIIPEAAFAGCTSLTSLVLPNSVTNLVDSQIGRGGLYGGVFWGCTSLTNVILGKGLTYLGLGTFTGCTNLAAVYFLGNAPAYGSWMFDTGPFWGAGAVIVYYLPGTSGWGTTYAGAPAMLWNPQVRTTDGKFGVSQNQFGFNVAGTADIPVVIEASSGLGGSWIPLQTCTLTNGLLYVRDPQWKNYPQRFYRIRSP